MSIYEINKLLSSENKSKIITHFWNCTCGQHSVSHMCGKLNLSQPNLSKHLGVLLKFGILLCQQKGKERYYSINPKFKNRWEEIIGPQINRKENKEYICPCSMKG